MDNTISKKSIRKAGDNLAAGLLSGNDKLEALELVGHWRAAHIEPLHKTLSMLENVCEQGESTILVSRLKRIETILNKLNRPNHSFNLITLRDIAGCRLIVPHIDDACHLAAKIEDTGQCRRKMDYITTPKESGYRGIHLVCRHSSPSYGYDNMDVEVQIRSELQHDWATAVEIYDLITGANLKFGSGSNYQKRYFKLVSDLINHEVEDELVTKKELQGLDTRLNILSILREASNSMYVISNNGTEITRSDSCLISVDISLQQISLEIYDSTSENTAAEKYTKLESNATAGNVYLLARAASFDSLRKAYPNYYSDISSFVNTLDGYLN